MTKLPKNSLVLIAVPALMVVTSATSARALNVESGGVKSVITTNTVTEGGGSSSVVIEQKVVSQSDQSSSTVVSEYKSENGRVVTDKTYTAPSQEESDNNKLANLKAEIEMEAQQKVDKAQGKVSEAKETIKEKVEDALEATDEATKDLDGIEDEIKQMVDERTEHPEQDSASWWQKLREWLNGVLRRVGGN